MEVSAVSRMEVIMSYDAGEHCTQCGKFVVYENIRWDRDIVDTAKGVPYCMDCWRKFLRSQE